MSLSSLTPAVSICAAYNLMSTSVMHPTFSWVAQAFVQYFQETDICDICVSFFVETWEFVGICAQFRKKYAMFGEV